MCRATALPVGPKPVTATPRRRRIVDMLRSLPMRAYLTLASARDREDGQAMVEYALLLFLIAVVSIAVLTVLGHRVSSLFNEISRDI
jgi:pilus assembly protein Flp/PilA